MTAADEHARLAKCVRIARRVLARRWRRGRSGVGSALERLEFAQRQLAAFEARTGEFPTYTDLPEVPC